MLPATRPPLRNGRPWWAYGAAIWSLVFAVRGVYWATGGTVGLGTLSQGIRDAAAAGDPQLYSALWITVALEVIGIGIAVGLARGGGGQLTRAALALLGSGAGAVLAAHGAMFIGFGLAAIAQEQPVSTELQWYALFWGPWFLLGGVVFLLAVRTHAKAGPRARLTRLARVAGLLGGLLAAAAPFVVSAVAGS